MLQIPICGLLLLLAAPAADEALSTRLRSLSAVGSAEVPRPSRDGSRLVFVTSLFGSRQAAVMPVDGGYPVQLTAEREGVVSLRYSPTDSRQLVAVVRRDGRRRIVLLDDQGSPAEEVERSPGDQLLGGFTRDGKRLFFATVSEGKARLFQLQLDGNKATEVLPGTIPPATGTFASAPPPPYTAPARRDAGLPDAGASDAGGSDAGASDAGASDAGAASGPAGGRPASLALAEVLPDVLALGPPSPDGRFLLLVTSKGGGNDVWSIELSSTRATLLTPHDGKARFADPRWSPDGRTVYVLDDAGRDRDGVDAIVVATRERKTVYAPNRRVEAYALSEDGHRLAVAEDAGGETVFGLLELPGLRAQPLPQPPSGALASAPEGESALAWSASGDRLFFAWSQADDTTDVLGFRMGFGAMVRLTRSPRPGLPAGSLPRPSRLTLTGADGKEMGAWIWRPGGGSRPKLALLLTGEEVRPVLEPKVGALVAAGFAVLGVNPRDGRGRLATGEDGVPDLAAAVRSARSQGDVDAQRPLLVAIGRGAAQAARLLKAQPDAFSGVVAMDSSERIQGAVPASNLQELVKAARDKAR
jgi:dipeptidyl aminopeptidase/acylaminoacyl peptidase